VVEQPGLLERDRRTLRPGVPQRARRLGVAARDLRQAAAHRADARAQLEVVRPSQRFGGPVEGAADLVRPAAHVHAHDRHQLVVAGDDERAVGVLAGERLGDQPRTRGIRGDHDDDVVAARLQPECLGPALLLGDGLAA
jgi:hypothetical protein